MEDKSFQFSVGTILTNYVDELLVGDNYKKSHSKGDVRRDIFEWEPL
jgi:hypothetical protein